METVKSARCAILGESKISEVKLRIAWDISIRDMFVLKMLFWYSRFPDKCWGCSGWTEIMPWCINCVDAFQKWKSGRCRAKAAARLWRSDFYCLGWTLCFACKTLYAICFSGWVRFLFRGLVSRSVCPIKEAYWTDFNANTVSGAAVPVNCNDCSMYAKFCRRLYWSPHVMTLMLTRDLSILLEICIYWQSDFTSSYIKRW